MKATIIKQLNDLNRHFYDNVADSFAQTRSRPWVGWSQLLPFLKETQQNFPHINILDIGCGTARFGEFLTQNLSLSSFSYIGVDSSVSLLEKAASNLSKIEISYQLKNEDIVNDVVQQIFSKNFSLFEPEIICLFGVLHHIPSLQIRSELLRQCCKLLPKNGTLIFATWQFDQLPQLLKRQVHASDLKIPANELEKNDQFLTWERDVSNANSAVRYCHLIMDEEVRAMTNDLPLKMKATFSADGATQKTNHYFVFEKI